MTKRKAAAEPPASFVRWRQWGKQKVRYVAREWRQWADLGFGVLMAIALFIGVLLITFSG